MGPKKQKTVTVLADANNTMIFVRKALSQLGWKVTKVDGYNVKAHTGISFTSWGEFVVVQLQIDNEHRTFLNVSSEFVFGLIDIGINQKNVNKFLATLSHLVQLA